MNFTIDTINNSMSAFTSSVSEAKRHLQVAVRAATGMFIEHGQATGLSRISELLYRNNHKRVQKRFLQWANSVIVDDQLRPLIKFSRKEKDGNSEFEGHVSEAGHVRTEDGQKVHRVWANQQKEAGLLSTLDYLDDESKEKKDYEFVYDFEVVLSVDARITKLKTAASEKKPNHKAIVREAEAIVKAAEKELEDSKIGADVLNDIKTEMEALKEPSVKAIKEANDPYAEVKKRINEARSPAEKASVFVIWLSEQAENAVGFKMNNETYTAIQNGILRQILEQIEKSKEAA